ncbi:hypothetical protein NVP1152O_062 [Vibrio phage 1.152.O._10N.222.46.E1]|uniref:Uncharacterized protein n=5 Tax=Nahantvirus 49C7 TaxID=2846601 RepID=A0A2I7RBF5_9CAUD|nr:hypothetical protein HYP57_gp061 [Vibrio phage 1.026.O._10N.222.49.C7]AUR82544.1 hypothetical protein NVP1025O_061 [Vibrio phage 1.025.O._10N.222.46.B6]AUR90794.1 hypothetical protein NVP1150O_061 [Vibrio phage 1.150.O._10N.222.46.A6]AUR90967.1 hypothetical protein NVP1152O_062 [Vibrio phage 1.152.O._10N.222.46.E1]AUS02435.1 hypothetical protein NVP2130O_061 [Vibrio phage 2.130.O._10N.222.46.C2]AUR82652.1 hypothetical protein NVP1026O_061 [Vibrio phage 1.026.O._10N.222.49.C7]
MSNKVFKTLESVREFMYVMNAFERDAEILEDSDYFQLNFCIPICRKGDSTAATAYRHITKSNDCGGCFFSQISGSKVNRDIDNALAELKLHDILEDSDA